MIAGAKWDNLGACISSMFLACQERGQRSGDRYTKKSFLTVVTKKDYFIQNSSNYFFLANPSGIQPPVHCSL